MLPGNPTSFQLQMFSHTISKSSLNGMTHAKSLINLNFGKFQLAVKWQYVKIKDTWR